MDVTDISYNWRTVITDDESREPPWGNGWEKKGRAALQAAGGIIPFAGGLLSAAASYWSENEQQKVNEFLKSWIQMLEDELREKQDTILDIVSRLDVHDEKISNRVRSSEYQSLLKKAFRNWAGAESVEKRKYIRNILSNAASTDISSDDVINLFLEWLQTYSEFHFAVIGEIYRNPGSTRLSIWQNLGKGQQREDSAEADLYKLLIRDLSMGSVIRQHRETDYAGNFLQKQKPRTKSGAGRKTMASAFDDIEMYELTALGMQFVHYAMNEVVVKLAYKDGD